MINKINKLPSLEILKILFRYEEGRLIRNFINIGDHDLLGWSVKAVKQWNTSKANQEAGYIFITTSGTKVSQVRVLGKLYYTHRLVYKLVTGDEPELVDHINGNPLDNRVENLRSVSNQENSKNARMNKHNTSGVTGVSWSKSANKWEAYIWKDCKKINLGLFSCLEEAKRVRLEAQQELEYHENHGRK